MAISYEEKRINDNFVMVYCMVNDEYREYKKYSPITKETDQDNDPSSTTEKQEQGSAPEPYDPPEGEGFMIKAKPQEKPDPQREGFRRVLKRFAGVVTEIFCEPVQPEEACGMMYAVMDCAKIHDPEKRKETYKNSLHFYHPDLRADVLYKKTINDLDKLVAVVATKRQAQAVRKTGAKPGGSDSVTSGEICKTREDSPDFEYNDDFLER